MHSSTVELCRAASSPRKLSSSRIRRLAMSICIRQLLSDVELLRHLASSLLLAFDVWALSICILQLLSCVEQLRHLASSLPLAFDGWALSICILQLLSCVELLR